MRYIIVNHRYPRGPPTFCTFCCSPLTDGYLREVGTRLLYCVIPFCYEQHVATSVVTIEGPKKRRKKCVTATTAAELPG